MQHESDRVDQEVDRAHRVAFLEGLGQDERRQQHPHSQYQHVADVEACLRGHVLCAESAGDFAERPGEAGKANRVFLEPFVARYNEENNS